MLLTQLLDYSNKKINTIKVMVIVVAIKPMRLAVVVVEVTRVPMVVVMVVVVAKEVVMVVMEIVVVTRVGGEVTFNILSSYNMPYTFEFVMSDW